MLLFDIDADTKLVNLVGQRPNNAAELADIYVEASGRKLRDLCYEVAEAALAFDARDMADFCDSLVREYRDAADAAACLTEFRNRFYYLWDRRNHA